MLTIRALPTMSGARLTFTVADGAAVALVGPSGSGKSRALRAIADLDPNSAEITLDGHPRDQIPAPQWRRTVMYVPTDSGWWDDRVGAHFPDPPAAVPFMEAMGLSADALDWPVARLSTGERQRLALCRALVREPRVLLLDEPTSALDADTTARVEAVLGDWLGDGGALILVTHDAEQVGRLTSESISLTDQAAETAA